MGNNRQSLLVHTSPHENECTECGEEWISFGAPSECPACEASMPEHGISYDRRDDDRSIEKKPVGDDPVVDLERRIEQIAESHVTLSDMGWGYLDGVLEETREDSNSSTHSRERRGRSKHALFREKYWTYRRPVDADYQRGPYWKEQREKAIQRDQERCQVCGISLEDHKEKHGRSLAVHHITPEREFDDSIEAHQLENLVAVCLSCHLRVEGQSREYLSQVCKHHDWEESDC